MMSSGEDVKYGNLSKKILFCETDHRHAQLLIRLKHDNLKQSDFLRHMVTGYLDGDERIVSYVDDVKPMSKTKKQKVNKLKNKGKNIMSNYSLSESEVENIFDLLDEDLKEFEADHEEE